MVKPRESDPTIIALEGIDGVGKTTQLDMLCIALQSRTKRRITKLSFPYYDSDTGKLIKKLLTDQYDELPPKELAMLYAINRSEYIHRVIESDDPDIIICDRYVGSNLIHQMPRLDTNKWDEFVDDIMNFETQFLKCPVPNITIMLDMSPDARKTIAKAKLDTAELDSLYQESCRMASFYVAGRLGWDIVRCDDNCEVFSYSDITVKMFDIISKQIML